MWVGNQQFTVTNITITNAQTAVFMDWNWGWTFQQINIQNCQVSYSLLLTSCQLLTSAFLLDRIPGCNRLEYWPSHNKCKYWRFFLFRWNDSVRSGTSIFSSVVLLLGFNNYFVSIRPQGQKSSSIPQLAIPPCSSKPPKRVMEN